MDFFIFSKYYPLRRAFASAESEFVVFVSVRMFVTQNDAEMQLAIFVGLKQVELLFLFTFALAGAYRISFMLRGTTLIPALLDLYMSAVGLELEQYATVVDV